MGLPCLRTVAWERGLEVKSSLYVPDYSLGIVGKSLLPPPPKCWDPVASSSRLKATNESLNDMYITGKESTNNDNLKTIYETY